MTNEDLTRQGFYEKFHTFYERRLGLPPYTQNQLHKVDAEVTDFIRELEGETPIPDITLAKTAIRAFTDVTGQPYEGLLST